MFKNPNGHGYIVAEFDGAASIGGVVVNSTTGITMHIVDADGETSHKVRLYPNELLNDTGALDTYGVDGNPEYFKALEHLTEAIGAWAEVEAHKRGLKVTDTDSADGGLYYYLGVR